MILPREVPICRVVDLEPVLYVEYRFEPLLASSKSVSQLQSNQTLQNYQSSSNSQHPQNLPSHHQSDYQHSQNQLSLSRMSLYSENRPGIFDTLTRIIHTFSKFIYKIFIVCTMYTR